MANNPTLPNIGNYEPLDKSVFYDYEQAYKNAGNVKIELFSLPWNPDNLPAFKSRTALDTFLETHVSKKIELRQFKNQPPTFSFPLPVPYDEALQYTYTRVELQQTAPSQTVPYENGTGKRTYYYFIDSVDYSAPSTTYFQVTLDVWHTFFDEIEIGAGDLKRGHLVNEYAPTVTEYLADPLNHTKYITAPDFNYGDPADKIGTSEFEQYGGSGGRYFIFWGNYSPADLQNAMRLAPYSRQSQPVFNDAHILTAEPWWIDGARYEEILPLPQAQNARANTGAPNGIFAYAVALGDGTKLSRLFEMLNEQGQHILMRTLGTAVLPSSLLTFDEKLTLAGWNNMNVYPLKRPDVPLTRKVTRALTVGKFDLPDEIKNYSKAYTYPYSHIVMTMPDGSRRDFQIETLGNAGASYLERLTFAFPWLRAETLMESYKANGSISYSWRQLDNATQVSTVNVPAGAWQEVLSSFDIPTFSLWRTAHSAYYADNAGSILAQRESAKNAQARGYANLERQRDNTILQTDISLANTRAANEAAYTSTVNSANVAYNNATAATSTAVANQRASNNLANTNNTAQNSYRGTMLRISNEREEKTVGIQERKTRWENRINSYYMQNVGEAQYEADSSHNLISGVSGIVSGTISGAAGGAVVGAGAPGAAVGALAGASAGTSNLILSSTMLEVSVTKNTEVNRFSGLKNRANVNIGYGGFVEGIEVPFNGDAIVSQTVVGANWEELNNKIYNDLRGNSETISFNNGYVARNTETAMQIVNNNKSVSDANAARSRDVTIANAARYRDVSNGNATDTSNATKQINQLNFRNNAITLQTNYITAMDNARHVYNAAALQPNRMQTQNAADASRDVLAERGTTVAYVKQTDDALIQLAQMWKRFGYSYVGRLMRPLTPATSTANTREPCTFWQIEDITFTKPLQRRWQEYIQDMLAHGLTFWKNPFFEDTKGI